jgi:hypothetical protein
MLVANDHQSVEAEAPPAFDHRRAATDLHHAFFNAVGPGFTISSHRALLMLIFILVRILT